MEKEIWKDIKGYEGLYQISNFGRVKSLARIIQRDRSRWGTPAPFKIKEKILHNTVVHEYLYVILCKDGSHKRYAVHRLVAQHFLSNPDNLPQVNHKDENPANNDYRNLEWCDGKYNLEYGTRRERQAKSLSESGKVKRGNNGRAKKVICDGVIYDCITDCAEHYGVNPSTFSSYLTGKDPMPPRWERLGFSYYREEVC